MRHTELVIQTIKILLKEKGKTYQDIAIALDISEASVKRIFSKKTFNLQRIEAICSHLDISIFELFSLADNMTRKDFYEYSFEQESFFSRNPKYLAFFDLLVNGQTPKSIQKKYQIPDKVIIKYLNTLDRLGLIEHCPGAKVKLCVSKNIKWLDDGPLKKLFLKKAKFEFLNADFKLMQDFQTLSILALTQESRAKLEFDLKSLYAKYEKLSLIERKLKLETHFTGLMLASRKWNFSILESITL